MLTSHSLPKRSLPCPQYTRIAPGDITTQLTGTVVVSVVFWEVVLLRGR